MVSAHARVATDRAGRYLTQLGEHGDHMSRRTFRGPRRHGDGGPAHVVHAEWSGADALIDFGWGRCTLRATDTELVLRAEAVDPECLRRVQEGITARLELIGRRDRLTVTWHPEFPEAEEMAT
ncbi:DUF2218 domain-containing protein [Actinoallomurus iriomotensis]|uniref:DUF2218 domain-containing protein n=1 Tax=Actinoallomurus iriomotensis TaxID=478107 RepID=A0A9W6RYG5_9ACTN|nr:DUF2218 domain-containing protein [Actinoallomurus iriomotensis]GLY83908.1 hypothetical protein Airi02_018370 [Actinoallomurus iriomotensis]